MNKPVDVKAHYPSCPDEAIDVMQAEIERQDEVITTQTAEIKRLTALLAQANATYVGMEAEIKRLRDALIEVSKHPAAMIYVGANVEAALKEQDNE